MEVRQTLGNNVMVKMDPDNDFVVTPGGLKLYIDTAFEPEKHIVRTGEVVAVPRQIVKTEKSLPWDTEMEIQVGDRVIMYFLAVQNCLAKERKTYVREGNQVWIIIKYQNIYAVIREGNIIPVNGYVLVEPIEDPEWIREKEKASKLNIELPDLRGTSKTHVTYGRIAYIGKPNKSYDNDRKDDTHYDLKAGDEVVMKRIRDIPVEYEYHAKIDGGRKLYRMQRHDILAKL